MNVTHNDLQDLFTFFATMKGDIDIYKDSHTTQEASDRCTAMMSRDYMVSLVPNTFCPTYPNDIILLGNLNLEGEEPIKAGELRAHEQFGEKLKEMMEASRLCRCRQRIPVPVLVIRNKILARSAGLSDTLETVYSTKSMVPLNDPVAFRRKMIEMDTKWLKTLLISDICDLMTEVKSGFLGVTLVASEKGFREYYDEGFALSALPYPGVQYFKNYVQSSGTGVYPIPPWHKWKLEPRLGRPMRLPNPYRWQDYKKWGQIELTQNIVRYLFSVFRDPKCSGMLVHCISGWDRTPHIVSLLRILLWAEGEAHQSLNVDQILYLTVAYDWFLFGHELAHRLKKSYEIMFYTLDVLGHLLSAEFSLFLGSYTPPTTVKEAPKLLPPELLAPIPSSSKPAPQPGTLGTPTPTASPSSLSPPHTPHLPEIQSSQAIQDPSVSPPDSHTSSITPSTSSSSDTSDTLGGTPTITTPTTQTQAPQNSHLPSILSPTVLPPSSNPVEHDLVSPRKSPSIAEMLSQPLSGMDLRDKIDARKHRLFELRDRFFYFYKAFVYPVYHK